MKSIGIDKSTLTFLRELAYNNNRPWFNDHKERYLQEYESMISFAEDLIREVGKFDQLVPMTGKRSLFRIYRDVRFSKDKSPYKGSFSGRLRRATDLRRGGMYYHIEPGNCLVAGGFWKPNSDDLMRIRKEIDFDDQPLRKILRAPQVKKHFGSLEGEQLKTSPQGYSQDHPAIDLLRFRQFLLIRHFTDAEAMDASFLQEVVYSFKALRPFFDYMSDVLTTNTNGERIV